MATRNLARLLSAFAMSMSPTWGVASSLPELDCVIEPNMTVELSSRADGIIENLLVERGDRVTAGQVVAKLDSRVEAASVAY